VLAVRGAGGARRIRLSVVEGAWKVDGREAPALRGCLDVDLYRDASASRCAERRQADATIARIGPDFRYQMSTPRRGVGLFAR
jgi:hypothetical protein